MMTTTHALFGASIGALATTVSPEFAPAAVLAGALGGALPDADLAWTHRRTTHFPVCGTAAAIPVVGACVAVGTQTAVLMAVFVFAAAVHPLMDLFAGGVGTDPQTSERAVYDHAHGQWLRPRRWVRYAGAPEELVLLVAAGLPALVATTGPTRAALVGVVVLSVLFVGLRRRLDAVAYALFADGS